ncbi:choice-of-anchor D domain-containing protein [Hyalangium rubrum]|uniref:Choice-of-anchor D domain-containing protein n=1 Tax=Hyalangium rubrum TaxID=3103134 RepID=A0ABU5HGM1_9BACT|nr:choice-of-anchor D domain-containing protein [Hyalangium sp. s54d21]MDY7232312.1 choice-of-anchor D domain-containing protein [Hyalangium sp. s54d21]
MRALVLVLLCVACGDDVARQVRPRLVAPPGTLELGAVPVLREATGEVPLINAGRAGLRVLGVRIQEEGAPFRVLSAPEGVDAAGAAAIQVAFVPPGEERYQATLRVETDDMERGTVDVALVGEGRTAAALELEPAVLDFGRVPEGQSVTRSFSVRALGTADLVLEDLQLTEDTSAAFGFVGSVRTPAVVDVGGEIQLTVRYAVPLGAEPAARGAVRLRSTDPGRREATVALRGEVNRAPVAVVAPVEVSVPGGEVVLDGTGSEDPDGDAPLSYRWVLRSRPVGAQGMLVAPEAARTVLRLDAAVPGEYGVELEVTDAAGARSLVPGRGRVVAAPAQQLLVEMFWDNAVTDMDLHVLRVPGAAPGSIPDDCHYANPRPDWGEPGVERDDPELLRDALTGYGPEVFGYGEPVAGSYRVAVVFSRANGAVDPRSTVTVRVYERGVVKGELRRTLSRQGETWNVADVGWPGGVITEAP